MCIPFRDCRHDWGNRVRPRCGRTDRAAVAFHIVSCSRTHSCSGARGVPGCKLPYGFQTWFCWKRRGLATAAEALPASASEDACWCVGPVLLAPASAGARRVARSAAGACGPRDCGTGRTGSCSSAACCSTDCCADSLPGCSGAPSAGASLGCATACASGVTTLGGGCAFGCGCGCRSGFGCGCCFGFGCGCACDCSRGCVFGGFSCCCGCGRGCGCSFACGCGCGCGLACGCGGAACMFAAISAPG